MSVRGITRVRLSAALAALIVAGAVSGAAAAPADRSAVRQAERRHDEVAARLAQVRTRMHGLGPDERRVYEVEEERLVALKERLRRRLATLEAGAVVAVTRAARRERRPTTTPAVRATTPRSGAVGIIAPLKSAPLSASVGVRFANERSGGLAATIDDYLRANGSPLSGLGSVFVAESEQVGLDPRFLVAIAGAETSFGVYGPSQTIHNPFGMGPGFTYPGWEDAIRAAARNLGGHLYLGAGLVTIPAIHARWAPLGATNDPSGLNSNWSRNVTRHYAALGGDPSGRVFRAGVGPSDAVDGTAGVAVGFQGSLAGPLSLPVRSSLGASGQGRAIAEEALGVLGTPFRAGRASPGAGFDAPGLIRWAAAAHGVSLPRTAADQSRVGVTVDPTGLRTGDAIFFADARGRVIHAGLYLGDGQFVHAGGPGELVKISSLYEPTFARSYAGARRY